MRPFSPKDPRPKGVASLSTCNGPPPIVCVLLGLPTQAAVLLSLSLSGAHSLPSALVCSGPRSSEWVIWQRTTAPRFALCSVSPSANSLVQWYAALSEHACSVPIPRPKKAVATGSECSTGWLDGLVCVFSRVCCFGFVCCRSLGEQIGPSRSVIAQFPPPPLARVRRRLFCFLLFAPLSVAVVLPPPSPEVPS